MMSILSLFPTMMNLSDTQLLMYLFLLLLLCYTLLWFGNLVRTILKYPFKLFVYLVSILFLFMLYFSYLHPLILPAFYFIISLINFIRTIHISTPQIIIDTSSLARLTPLSEVDFTSYFALIISFMALWSAYLTFRVFD